MTVMCDIRWTLAVLLATSILVAWLVPRLLQHQAEGSANTASIIVRLRQQIAAVSGYPKAMTARELTRRVRSDHELRRRVGDQDFELLRTALAQQFRLAIGVYAGATILIGIAVFGLVGFRPHPPRITGWELRSETSEAEGRAVDTDHLILSWKAEGCTENIELWLEDVQSGVAIPTQGTSNTQQQLRRRSLPS